jgi:hypothetical protein
LVKPKREDEKLVMQAVSELTEGTLTGTGTNAVLDKYVTQMSPESFNDVMTIAHDLMA